ncbi:MAG: co-chaperone GroES [Anaerolineae bacterium]|jgi:chaperonin GroES|nr:co-chaperone GroES [Anaerolineae bacterium]MBT3313472.1 co-chaperone GroES [Anaerolineae bacterium]MBT3321710.1 co-chaperone GroES [Anaerolineae bacterium]MBT4308775.1 co-chaperone GroES [Anaerolineae bacterium]MBT4460004.1 co-chaperone GroES [Anaerolineae bacterium]
MAKTLKPLGDRIIVESIKDDLSAGGIALPETAKDEPQRGFVLAVGPGLRATSGERITMDVVVGDEILFARYGGSSLKHEGKDLLILREDEILAIIEN